MASGLKNYVKGELFGFFRAHHEAAHDIKHVANVVEGDLAGIATQNGPMLVVK